MKRLQKILFTILLITPMFVSARTNYNSSVGKTNNYISNFNKYHDYIVYQNMPYNYENGINKNNAKFKTGGLLSKDEYLITNVHSQSYLGLGIEFWTLTQHSVDKNYVIDFSLKSKDLDETSNTRVTQFVKKETKIKGSGTKNNPWVFVNVKSVNLYSSDSTRGTLSAGECTNINEGLANITVPIYENTDSVFSSCPSPYFRYKDTTCSSFIHSIASSNKHNIDSNINDNTICKINFAYVTYDITLEQCANCSAVEPNIIYMSVNPKYFFEDDWGEKSISTLKTKPAKTGYTFNGYVYDKDDNWVTTNDQFKIIDSSGKITEDETIKKEITNNITIKSIFTTNTYNIKYEYDGGTKGTESPTSAKYDEVITISNPTKLGYTFAGWTIIEGLNTSTAKYGSNSNPTTAISSSSTKIKSQFFKNINPTNNATVTLKANWTANKYTIEYEYNGGTKGTSSPSTGTYNSVVTISNPTRTGYTFKGWTITSGLNTDTAKHGTTTNPTTAISSSSTKIVSEYFKNINPTNGTVVKFTANWQANQYSISFNENGATTSGTKSITATYDATMPKITTPKKKYTITYNANGGSVTPSSAESTLTFEGYNYNNTKYYDAAGNGARTWNVANNVTLNAIWSTAPAITLPTPSRTGYTFSNWNTKQDGTGTKYNAGTSYTPSATTTLYAQWTINTYKVTISINNTSYGTVSNSSVTIPYGSTYSVSGGKLSFSNGTSVTASPTSATGYTTKVSSWSSTSGTITAATTITVNFTRSANNYTVSYNANGGSVSPASKTVTYNSTYGSLPTPTKANSKFLGWYTSSSGGTQITSSTKVSITANQTIYAHWELIHVLPIFTYTGSYQLVQDNDTVIASGTNSKVTIPSSYLSYTGNWKIRFLSSGTITFHELRGASNGIDVFIVGGGGNGGGTYAAQAGRNGYSSGGGGGGGGYRTTKKGVSVSTTSYGITIGGARGTSSGFGYSASGGGNGASQVKFDVNVAGGSGGATGGVGAYNLTTGGAGGTGGCEFEECSTYSRRYGGGGGGGHGHNGGVSYSTGSKSSGVGNAGAAGAGGGGTGNNQYRGYNTHNGAANTGGGGGGASHVFDVWDAGGSCWSSNGCFGVSRSTVYRAGTGGSGIVIIRNKR